MVYIERAETAAVSRPMAPAMSQPNSAVSTPTPVDVVKIALYEADSHTFRITCDKSAVSLLESGE